MHLTHNYLVLRIDILGLRPSFVFFAQARVVRKFSRNSTFQILQLEK